MEHCRDLGSLECAVRRGAASHATLCSAGPHGPHGPLHFAATTRTRLGQGSSKAGVRLLGNEDLRVIAPSPRTARTAVKLADRGDPRRAIGPGGGSISHAPSLSFHSAVSRSHFPFTYRTGAVSPLEPFKRRGRVPALSRHRPPAPAFSSSTTLYLFSVLFPPMCRPFPTARSGVGWGTRQALGAAWRGPRPSVLGPTTAWPVPAGAISRAIMVIGGRPALEPGWSQAQPRWRPIARFAVRRSRGRHGAAWALPQALRVHLSGHDWEEKQLTTKK